MWRDILDYGRQLLELTQTAQNNKRRIKELSEENKRLADAVEGMTYFVQHEVSTLRLEMQHLRESEKAARENEILRFENTVLRAGHQLPPANAE